MWRKPPFVFQLFRITVRQQKHMSTNAPHSGIPRALRNVFRRRWSKYPSAIFGRHHRQVTAAMYRWPRQAARIDRRLFISKDSHHTIDAHFLKRGINRARRYCCRPRKLSERILSRFPTAFNATDSKRANSCGSTRSSYQTLTTVHPSPTSEFCLLSSRPACSGR